MKTINAFLLLALITPILNAQDKQVEKVYYENSNELHYEYEYIMGRTGEVTDIVSRDSKTGEITGYDPGGHKISEIIKHGYYKEYYPDGKLMTQLNYENGKKKGAGKHYYESGKIKSEFSFSFNVLVGDFILYYENGQKMDVCRYDGGKRAGAGELFTEDGTLLFDLNYLPNDEQNYETYNSYASANSKYPTGGVYQQGRIKLIYPKSVAYEYSNFNYVMDGEWKTYDEKGNLISLEPYKDDLIEGTVINYHSNGNKKEEIECIITENNGELVSVIDGYYKSFHENGKLSSQGLLVSTQNDDGPMTPKKFFVWRWYDENGQPIVYKNFIADEVKKTIEQSAISQEENIDANLPFTEVKQIVLSKYGKNYIFHFEAAYKPYLGCKMYYDNCSIRKSFYIEIDKMLSLFNKEMELCTSIECLEKWVVRSNTAYQIMEEASQTWEIFDFDTTTQKLKSNSSLENKMSVIGIK